MVASSEPFTSLPPPAAPPPLLQFEAWFLTLRPHLVSNYKPRIVLSGRRLPASHGMETYVVVEQSEKRRFVIENGTEVEVVGPMDMDEANIAGLPAKLIETFRHDLKAGYGALEAIASSVVDQCLTDTALISPRQTHLPTPEAETFESSYPPRLDLMMGQLGEQSQQSDGPEQHGFAMPEEPALYVNPAQVWDAPLPSAAYSQGSGSDSETVTETEDESDAVGSRVAVVQEDEELEFADEAGKLDQAVDSTSNQTEEAPPPPQTLADDRLTSFPCSADGRTGHSAFSLSSLTATLYNSDEDEDEDDFFVDQVVEFVRKDTEGLGSLYQHEHEERTRLLQGRAMPTTLSVKSLEMELPPSKQLEASVGLNDDLPVPEALLVVEEPTTVIEPVDDAQQVEPLVQEMSAGANKVSVETQPETAVEETRERVEKALGLDEKVNVSEVEQQGAAPLPTVLPPGSSVLTAQVPVLVSVPHPPSPTVYSSPVVCVTQSQPARALSPPRPLAQSATREAAPQISAPQQSSQATPKRNVSFAHNNSSIEATPTTRLSKPRSHRNIVEPPSPDRPPPVASTSRLPTASTSQLHVSTIGPIAPAEQHAFAVAARPRSTKSALSSPALSASTSAPLARVPLVYSGAIEQSKSSKPASPPSAVKATMRIQVKPGSFYSSSSSSQRPKLLKPVVQIKANQKKFGSPLKSRNAFKTGKAARAKPASGTTKGGRPTSRAIAPKAKAEAKALAPRRDPAPPRRPASSKSTSSAELPPNTIQPSQAKGKDKAQDIVQPGPEVQEDTPASTAEETAEPIQVDTTATAILPKALPPQPPCQHSPSPPFAQSAQHYTIPSLPTRLSSSSPDPLNMDEQAQRQRSSSFSSRHRSKFVVYTASDDEIEEYIEAPVHRPNPTSFKVNTRKRPSIPESSHSQTPASEELPRRKKVAKVSGGAVPISSTASNNTPRSSTHRGSPANETDASVTLEKRSARSRKSAGDWWVLDRAFQSLQAAKSKAGAR